jgi:hypothetical protein
MPSDPHSPFRRKRSKLILLAPLYITFVMVLAVLDLAFAHKAGFSAMALIALLLAVFGGRSRLDAIEVEEQARESALHDPDEARFLNKLEAWLYMLWPVVMTPSLSRLVVRMVTDGKGGELGFGGIIFIVGGFALGLVIGGSAMIIQRYYVQDNYRVRWLVNLIAVGVAFVVIFI